MLRPLTGALLCATCFSVLADEADINISNKSINAQANFLTGSRDIEFGAGYVYREGGTNVVNGDLHARGQTVLGNLPTTVGVGGRLSYLNEDRIDGAALAFGGFAHIKIPEVPGLGFKGSFHLAPSITSFSDVTQFMRTDIRATYRVIQNADVYAGYRNIRAEIAEIRKVTVDEAWHLGFTLHF